MVDRFYLPGERVRVVEDRRGVRIAIMAHRGRPDLYVHGYRVDRGGVPRYHLRADVANASLFPHAEATLDVARAVERRYFNNERTERTMESNGKSTTEIDFQKRGTAIRQMVEKLSKAPRGAYINVRAMHGGENFLRRALSHLVIGGVFEMRSIGLGKPGGGSAGVTTEYRIRNDEAVLKILEEENMPALYVKWVRNPPTRKLPEKKVAAAPTQTEDDKLAAGVERLAKSATELSEEYGGIFEDIIERLGFTDLIRKTGYQPLRKDRFSAGRVFGADVTKNWPVVPEIPAVTETGERGILADVDLARAARIHDAVEILRRELGGRS